MNLLDYFKPVTLWSAEEVKDYLDRHNPDAFNLIDVRQPWEYEQKHLPGARLAPVEELAERAGEFDRTKQTIAYCSIGPRSRAAGSILLHAGFREVAILKGGIRAWEGLTAEGDPETGVAWFAAGRPPEECVALAWHLENGTLLFYQKMAERFDPQETETLFLELSAAEEQHQRMLAALYEGLTKKKPGKDFPAGRLPEEPAEQIMEGGVRLAEALAWSEGKALEEVLELAIGIEANAYDRYLYLRRELQNENARRIFEVLSDEEKRHLKRLSHLREHCGRPPGS
jgi:rhodanese-related sulfurtransferase/rubrerythrin